MDVSRRRPNILLVVADQLSALATSPYGNREVLTPNMQALADRGVMFQYAYCNSPLCSPSRASMVSGRWPGNIASYDNDCELPATTPTFLHHLRLAGYETVLSGKMHFVGPDQHHGFERRLTTDIYDADFSTLKSWEHAGDPVRVTALPDDPESAARYELTIYLAERLRQAGPVKWTIQLDYDEEVQFRALEQLRAFGRRQGTQASQPWFLCVSYTHPHDPPFITPEYWDRYDDVDIALPAPSPPGHVPHPADEWVNCYHGLDAYPPTADETRRARRAYYGMVSYVDDKVGELVRELDRAGLSEETIVILTSDHGDMVGERGMWFKRTQYEWSVRVPLIIAPGGQRSAGQHIEQNVSLVDLYPSLLSLTQVDPPRDVPLRLDGHDVTPLLTDRQAAWSNEVIIENYGEGTIAPIRVLVKDRLKCIHVHEQRPQLFDLDADPGEWHNVIDNPAYAGVARALEARLVDGWNSEEMYARIVESQRIRRFVKRALETGRRTSWDFQPFFDATTTYSRRRRAGGPGLEGKHAVDRPSA